MDHSSHAPADEKEEQRFGHRRAFERVGDTLLVSYSISDDFAPEFTETYDIALGGMAMITNAQLQKDAPIRVQLELRGDTNPVIRMQGMVRWSSFDPLLSRYRTGVAFTEIDDATRGDLVRYIDTLRLLRDMGVV
ncbi:MAG TPA: PilZ domain-containing protein [Candidatus Baltobacteraceae bacterium]